MKTTKRDRMLNQIFEHGENLIRIFPLTSEPAASLCRKLHRLEIALQDLATGYCNGSYGLDYIDIEGEKLLKKAREILVSDRPWFNRDPRGYALKIDLKDGEKLHRDMGGYGILAPEFDGN